MDKTINYENPTNLKMDHIKVKDLKVSFLVLDLVGSSDLKNGTLVWSDFRKLNKEDWKDDTEKLEYKKKFVEEYSKMEDIQICLDWDDFDQNGGDVYRIDLEVYFSPALSNIQSTLHRYLSEFLADLIGVWLTTGGDDSFYDYDPSYTDIFRQLCENVHGTWYWDKLIKFLKELDPEILEEALYCTELVIENN